MIYPLSQLTIGLLIRLFIKKVYGKQNVIKDKPFIIACNHSSYLDDFAVPKVIIPISNKKVHFYSKSDYYNNYFIRKFLEYHGCIPIYSKKNKNYKKLNKKAFKTALMYLRKNEIIGIFPEGTRSIDGKLQKAKPGVANLAITSKVPILPIGIIGSHKILPKGKYLPRFRRCEINIGRPMYLNKYHNKKVTKTLLRKITNEVMKEIAKLCKQEYNY